jgi:hypothetical protein
VLEALRLSPPITPFLRISDTFPSISDWRYKQAIKKGDILLLDIATASRDPARYPYPEQIKLDRQQDLYLPFVDGPYSSLLEEIVIAGLVVQLRVLGKLEGLQKVPGGERRVERKTNIGVVNFHV